MSSSKAFHPQNSPFSKGTTEPAMLPLPSWPRYPLAEELLPNLGAFAGAVKILADLSSRALPSGRGEPG